MLISSTYSYSTLPNPSTKPTLYKKPMLICPTLQSRVDIDVASSTVGRSVCNLVIGYFSSLVLELAFVIQGNTREELPETLLGTSRLNRVDVSKALVALP
ncbi:Homeobox-leucine zipper ATHB-14-like protein [Gossypium australe]|uniref:Homeobox-leucine zipper ATHB-14-like protein n=1 Tax=Gossypium australe TaxID=47621 RepID=A0A5B6U9B1_9ROSI|nr:Homeobox-leucine zipper ATHB-14-like protein [Gossypium australe]